MSKRSKYCVTAYIDPRLKRAIEKSATEQGVSASHLLRRLLMREFSAAGPNPAPTTSLENNLERTA